MQFKYESFVNQVNREIAKAERRLMLKAARHVRKKIRDNISNRSVSQDGAFPGLRTGNLKKGIKNKRIKSGYQVGSTSPHSHLLEYGHKQVTRDGKIVGDVKPRPFIFRTFKEEQDAVYDIISEKWV